MLITLLALHTQLPDKFGITPLLAAIYEGHEECVKLLIANVSQSIIRPSCTTFISLFHSLSLPSPPSLPSLPLSPSLSSLLFSLSLSPSLPLSLLSLSLSPPSLPFSLSLSSLPPSLPLFPPSLPLSLPPPPLSSLSSLSSLRVQTKMSRLQTDHPTKIVQRVTKSRIF